MAFVPYGQAATVTLGVVAYGMTDRLAACIESLVSHEAEADFDVVCVVNPDQRDVDPDVASLPRGVHAIVPDANLGWAGGMHLVRHASSSDWLGWIQDDSTLLPGWLDAHMAAAIAHPEVGAFGAVALDASGRAAGFSGGSASPGTGVRDWSLSDPTRHGNKPTGVELRDWITSKGMLVRLTAWDDVGGPCARHFPLNCVDLELSTHLRTHGWKLVLVPDANLTHLQSQSAPGLFREFVSRWHEEEFDFRWGDPVRRLAASNGEAVEHDCHGHPDIASIERECLREASRMVVPLGKYASARLREEERRRAEELEIQSRLYVNSASWRVTAPLRWVRSLARKAPKGSPEK